MARINWKDLITDLLLDIGVMGLFSRAHRQPPLAIQPPQVVLQQGPPAGQLGNVFVQVQPPAQPAPAAPATPPAQPGAAAVNALNAAGNLGARAAQGMGQLATQAAPYVQQARQGLVTAVDDAWVLPAQILAAIYAIYITIFFVLAAGDLQARMDWLSYYYPAATHGWYTLVLLAQGLTALIVLILGMVAVADPTPGDRLNFPATFAATVIMLLNIPTGPLLMASAVASAVHSARLANVPVEYLSELYVQGNAYLVSGAVLAVIYYGIAALIISTSDIVLDALRGRNVPLERVQAWIKTGMLLVGGLIGTRYLAMLYGPSPVLTEDFLDYGLVVVVVALILFALTKIPVSLKTRQWLVGIFLTLIVGTMIWKWISVRHGTEVDQTVSQVENAAPSRPFLTQLFWDMANLPFWNGLALMILLAAVAWGAKLIVFSGTEAFDGKTKGLTRFYQVLAGIPAFIIRLCALFIIGSIFAGDLLVLANRLPPSP